MLMPFEILIDNKVRVTDNDHKRYNQIGNITFIESKLGFRNSYPYHEITVKFIDMKEDVFKSWYLNIV